MATVGVYFYHNLKNISSNENEILNDILYIMFLHTGPITYTSQEGTTTLHGVVAMSGDMPTNDTVCQVNTAMISLSAPKISSWIKTVLSKYE